MKPSANRVATRHRSAGKNPHIDKNLASKLQAIAGKTESLSDEFKSLSEIFGKAADSSEDAFAVAHKAWIARGEHPDDFADSPIGESMWEAMSFYRDAEHALSPTEHKTPGNRLYEILYEIDKLAQKAK